MLETWKHGHILSHNYFSFLCPRNPVLLYVVQDQFQAQSTSRMTFHQEEEDDKDMTPMHMTMFGAWVEEKEASKGVKVKKEAEANSIRVPEVEAQSNSSSSLPRNSGPVCLKLVTQDASRLRFRRSTYG